MRRGVGFHEKKLGSSTSGARNQWEPSKKSMAVEGYASDKIHTDVLSTARSDCYKARDAFYACLEKESKKPATEIASVGLLYPIACRKSRVQYEKACRSSWVKHFDRQYCGKKRVERLLDDNESRRTV